MAGVIRLGRAGRLLQTRLLYPVSAASGQGCIFVIILNLI